METGIESITDNTEKLAKELGLSLYLAPILAGQSKPSQSLLQKCLRERYRIIVWVYPIYTSRDDTLKYDAKVMYFQPSGGGDGSILSLNNQRDSYEDALEIGLFAGLKIICDLP